MADNCVMYIVWVIISADSLHVMTNEYHYHNYHIAPGVSDDPSEFHHV